MLVCRACWKRAVGRLASPALANARRTLTTQTVQTEDAVQQPSSSGLATSSAAVSPATASPGKSSAETSSRERSSKALEWAVNKQLEYLKDPFKIAHYVQRILEKDNFEEAILLTRKASRDHRVTVSWNHAIDYQMRNQRLNAAVKLYNEMKKRGQLPDARTFTILFRGCANSAHPKLAVSEAVRIYHTMLTNERVKPNTIHLNAVLEACARAGDIDTMFSILHTVDNGPRGPDTQTYTIVLNALRPKPDIFARSTLSDPEADAADKLAIQRAKAIWEAVVADWRKGKVMIDEELVCAIGRVLLAGDYHDNASILPLLSQTMKLPRLDLVKGDLEAATADAAAAAEDDSSDLKPAPAGYASPGRNTLSLVLTSLAATRKTSLGPRYWALLTETHGVVPDAENYHSMLRLLRVGKASSQTARIVADMPASFAAPKTFRIALSTCVGDNLNQHAFHNASAVFDAMVARLRRPDAHAMRLYLQAARANFSKFNKPAATRAADLDGPGRATTSSGADGDKFALGRQIVAALDRMWQPFRILSSSFSYPEGPTRSPQEAWTRDANERREAIAVARRMVAAMDTIVTEGMAAPEVVKVMKTRRNILNRHVTRFFEKEQSMGGSGRGEEKKGKKSGRTGLTSS